MYSEIFEEIGLSPNEAKIYETLLSTGETSVSEISVKANVHRRNIYDALSRLIEKGLVFPIFQKGENKFKAVNPDKLLETIKAKEKKLNAILPELQKKYVSEPTHEAAYIYKGIEGYKNYRRDLTRVNEETFFLGSKGLWLSPHIDKTFRTTHVDPFNKRKKPYFMLFDPRVPNELPQALADVAGHYKILPAAYATPGVVDIFGDYVVTFTSVGVGNIDDNVSIFVMINKELAESYKTWFRFMWDSIPE